LAENTKISARTFAEKFFLTKTKIFTKLLRKQKISRKKTDSSPCDYGSATLLSDVISSVAEPHHYCAAPGKNFDAGSAPAPAPTLQYSNAKFLKLTKV
jgi:hypothetical protein